MAGKPRASFATTKKQQNYTSKWLRNAMKSIGITANEAIKEIAPNIHEVASTGVKASMSIATSIRRNTSGVNKINDSLKNNKYVQLASKAYQNAMSDIKTGNFNNKDRENGSMESSMFGDINEATEGFSFGDDGADNNVNINYVNASDNDAIASLSTQMQKQATAQAKMTKANMDAYIAVSAANMQQVGSLGAEIVSSLSNINSNLSSLVQYNNENITRYIEASLAYYDKLGSRLDRDDSSSMSGKLTSKDVLYGGKGGLNIGNYKNYVKQQMKEMVEKSNLGLIKSIITDDSMMEMLASNPIGFLSQGLSTYMIPKVLTTSLESMESTFNNMMPNLLSKIADLADTVGDDNISKIKRAIGKTFGLKNERITNFNSAKIERGQIPFDGETKHAITEVITKELRNQTSYLEIIATHFDKNAKANAKSKGEYWDWETNSYIKNNEIDSRIGNQIVDSIESAFNDTKFGKSMQKLVSSQRTDAARDEMEFSIRELYTEIEKQGKSLSMKDLIDLINSTGASGATKKVIKDYVKKMQNNDRNSFDSLNIGRLNSQTAANDTKKMMLDDPTYYHLFDSSFVGYTTDKDGKKVDINVDDILSQTMKYGKNSNRKDRNKSKMHKADISSPNIVAPSGSGKLSDMVNTASNYANDMMKAVISGDPSQIIEQGATILTDQFKSIGGKLSNLILGEKDENNNHKDGLVSGFTDKFKTGMNGWIDALFGTDKAEDPEKARKEQIDKMKGFFNDAIPNAAIGGGIGLLASGGLIGSLVGGPIGSVALGSALGILSKSEKFQNYLFGEKDEDGNRKGGLISKGVQDFFNKNKKAAGYGAAIGTGIGALTGGGALGTLLGGPIAGALMGTATGLITQTETFQQFLFGPKDENGDRKGGIKDKIVNAFKKNYKNENGDVDSSKLLGMAMVGTAGGGLLGALAGGPVVGAMAGLALSIKAQSGGFKEWLFGEEDGLDLGNGKKAKKQGVFGQFANYLHADIIKPMKTEVSYIAKDFMITLKHDILMPFGVAAEAISGKVGEVASNMVDGVKGIFGKLSSGISKGFAALFPKAAEFLGGGITKITDLAYGTFRKIISTPGKLITAIFKAIDIKNKIKQFVSPITNAVKSVGKVILKGVGGIFKFAMDGVKDVIHLATAPFRGMWKGAKKVGGFIGGKIKNLKDTRAGKFAGKVVDEFNNLSDDATFGQILGFNSDAAKLARKMNKEQKAENTRHDKNAKLIAKWTHGQFSEDTEEARQWLKINNRAKYEELVNMYNGNNTSTTVEMNGISVQGMTNDQLAKADPSKLNEQGRQTYILQSIFDLLKMKPWDDDSDDNEENNENTNDARMDSSSDESTADDEITEDIMDHSDVMEKDRNKEEEKALNNRFFGRTRKNAYNLYNKVKKGVSKVISKLPHFAEGGTTDKDGIAVVGENGPELANLPKGTTITPMSDAERARARNEKNRAKIEAENKKALSDAIDKGKTSKEQKEELEKKKKEEDEIRDRKKLVENTKNMATTTKEHSSLWSKIFGKKGLITAAAITGFLYLKKNFPALVDGLMGLVGKIIGISGGTIADIIRDVLRTEKNKERTNGNSAEEQAQKNIQDLKDGNILTDENGNATSQTDPRLLFLGRTGMNFVNSRHHMPFESKYTKLEKKVFNAGKDIYKGGKNIVKKAGNALNKSFKKSDFVKKLGSSASKDSITFIKDGTDLSTRAISKSAFETMTNGMDDAERALFKAQNGFEVLDDAEGLGRKAINKLSGTKLGKGVKNIGGKVATGVKNVGAKMADTKLVTGSSKLLDTVCKYVANFFDDIAKKLSEKIGKSVGAKIFKKVSSSTIVKTLKAGWSKISAKISAVFTAKTAAGAGTAGISELVFTTLSAINGLSGTAKLFRVDKSEVDGKMRVIATILGAISGTTPGSILDIVFGFVGNILGFDILNSLATAMYSAWANEEDTEALKNAQGAWEDAYHNYQTNAIKESYEKQLADGTIDPSVTEEDFIAGVQSGEYKAEYKSFDDWNTDKNKSIGDHIATGAGKVFKGAKNLVVGAGKGIAKGAKAVGGFIVNGAKKVGNIVSNGAKAVGGFVLNGAKKTGNLLSKAWTGLKSGVSTNAGRFVNGMDSVALATRNFFNSHTDKAWFDTDGSYYKTNGKFATHYNPNGDVIGENISMEDFEDLCKSGKLTEGEVKVDSGLKQGLKAIGNKISSTWAKATTALSEGWNKFKDNAGKFITDVNKAGGIGKYIGGLFKKQKTFGWYDTNGSYYVLQDDETYTYYNSNGDEIKTGVKSEDVEEMISSGLLTKGEVVKDSKAQEAVKSIRSAVSDAWDKAKNTVTNAWSSFKAFLGGGTFEKSSNMQKGGYGKLKRSKVLGGYGTDMFNGTSYFSQKDSRWANDAYNTGNDNATMGEAGCGPAAMAMAVNTANGNKVTPTDMANLAKITGNRDATGTNANFINQSANIMGLNSEERVNPSEQDIDSQLSSGNPVVMLGQDGGNGSSPYTNSGHYVVAVGKDNSGNVLVNDPRGKEYSKKYNMKTVADKTGYSWSIGNGGLGKGKIRNKKNKKGGFGVNREKWISIIKAVKQAIAAQKPGYNQKNWIKITVGGKTLSVRTDCSGFVTACLKFYGVLDDNANIRSVGYTDANNGDMRKSGFTSGHWRGWDSLQEGDIIARDGHVEIFAYIKNNKHYVYNCGSDSTVNNPNANIDSSASYTTVWSPGNAGSSSISDTSIESTETFGSTGSSSSGGITDLFSTLGSFMSEFGKRALSGNYSTDYSDVFNPGSSYASSDTSGSDSGDNGDIADASNISASSVAEKAWKYFTSAGYSKAATAGILGNFQQESSMNPSAIQGHGKGPAAGIAQWENYNTKSGRWKGLSDYAAKKGKDWTDLNSQLEFTHNELRSLSGAFWRSKSNMAKAGTTGTTYDEWKNSDNVETATRQFEGAFERAGKPNMANRVAAANKYYNLYAGGAGDFNTGINNARYYKPSTTSSKVSNSGGFGIDTVSTFTSNNNTHSSRYRSAANAQKYTSNNSVNDLLVGVINVLETIAGNTSDTSTKLNALNELKNIKGGNTTNIVQSKNGGNTTNNIQTSSRGRSKKDETAYRIARAGK